MIKWNNSELPGSKGVFTAFAIFLLTGSTQSYILYLSNKYAKYRQYAREGNYGDCHK
ncbi:hypothetical protein F310043J5_17370 [Anaerostipes hominis (ex Lee et al. 2021)]